MFTLEALEPGLALGADLVSLSPLILVTGPANGEGTLVAGDEEIAVDGESHVVAADLADLPAQLLQRPRLPENTG